jgi:hypothetical protein
MDRSCPYCGMSMVGLPLSRKTCGREECKREYHRERRQDPEYKEKKRQYARDYWLKNRSSKKTLKTCRICGIQVYVSRKNYVTCGAKECQRENQRRAVRRHYARKHGIMLVPQVTMTGGEPMYYLHGMPRRLAWESKTEYMKRYHKWNIQTGRYPRCLLIENRMT